MGTIQESFENLPTATPGASSSGEESVADDHESISITDDFAQEVEEMSPPISKRSVPSITTPGTESDMPSLLDVMRAADAAKAIELMWVRLASYQDLLVQAAQQAILARTDGTKVADIELTMIEVTRGMSKTMPLELQLFEYLLSVHDQIEKKLS